MNDAIADQNRVLCLVRGTINSRETLRARERAYSGDFDPPESVRCLLEFEEPNGSYMEIVEADDIAAVHGYIDKSRHLFKAIVVSRIETFVFTDERCDCAYLVEIKGPDHAIEISDTVLDVLTEEGDRTVIVNRTSHSDLFTDVAKVLARCDDIRVAPVMDVRRVWELGFETAS